MTRGSGTTAFQQGCCYSYGLLIGWQVPPAIDQFTAGSWWWAVCAPAQLRHRNLQATRLFCQHPVSPDLEGLPNLGDLPHLVLSFDLLSRAPKQSKSGLWNSLKIFSAPTALCTNSGKHSPVSQGPVKWIHIIPDLYKIDGSGGIFYFLQWRKEQVCD